MSYLRDENCPTCGTAMTYQLGENNFMCKCTYELELEIEPSIDEIVGMVKEVRKEMAKETDKRRAEVSDQLEDGYKLLAKDPEMSRPNRKSFGHHCGFDFAENQKTATCTCGSVATNPFWTIKGEQK